MLMLTNGNDTILTPASGINIDANFTGFNAASLHALADFFEDQATLARGRAIHYETHDQATKKVHKDLKYYREQLPKFVRRYLRRGYELDDAIALASDVSKIPFDTVQIHWTYFVRAKRKKDIMKRNKLIIQLAEMGFSNQAIGRRFDLHENSVSRIISTFASDDFRRGRFKDRFERPEPPQPKLKLIKQ